MKNSILIIAVLALTVASLAHADKLTLTPASQDFITDSGGDDGVLLVKFNPPPTLEGARIIRATLSVPVECSADEEVTYWLHVAPAGWSGAGKDWTWWQQAEAGLGPMEMAHVNANPCSESSVSFDAPSWLRGWISEELTNNGLVIRKPETGDGGFPFDNEGEIQLSVVYRPSS